MQSYPLSEVLRGSIAEGWVELALIKVENHLGDLFDQDLQVRLSLLGSTQTGVPVNSAVDLAIRPAVNE